MRLLFKNKLRPGSSPGPGNILKGQILGALQFIPLSYGFGGGNGVYLEINIGRNYEH